MKFYLWTAKKFIWGNRGRAIIPLLGIAAGVSLVFVILSIGEGGRRTVRTDLSLLGENRIMVVPGSSRRAKAFDERDAARIEGIPGVEYVHLTENKTVATTSRGNQVEVTGYRRRAMDAMEVEVVKGSGFPLGRGEILIDERTAMEEYGSLDVAGRGLEISTGSRKREYKISGVYRNGMDGMKIHGGTMVAGEEMEEILGRVRSREMIVSFYPEEKPEGSYSLILSTLDRAHGGRDLYRISETNGRYQRIKKIMRIINMSLGAMGTAALLLGGAGVANLMLLSINERRSHIGILRAVGTPGAGVGKIFLIETLILTTAGGILGIPGGFIASEVVGRVTGVSPSYGLWQVGVTLLIAIAMGGVAGYYPAMKAAKMEPIEAIRDN